MRDDIYMYRGLSRLTGSSATMPAPMRIRRAYFQMIPTANIALTMTRGLRFTH